MKLRCGERMLSLDRPVIMGVLNVTPDSFSDGGRWFDARRAIAHAHEMLEEGATIVDVGGESTRPGADPVPEEEELRRVMPVIEALAGRVEATISIDTRKPSIARRAVDAGASIINDTRGEASGRDMDAIAAGTDAAIVLMHSRGTPATMQSLAAYDDVVKDVADFLRRRAAGLQEAGIERDRIALDPGFGFAKTPEHNFEMLRRLDEFVDLGYPLLVGTSRKSFIGRVLDLPEDQRVEGTLATVVWAISKGAHIFRVHDVQPTVRALKIAQAIRGTP